MGFARANKHRAGSLSSWCSSGLSRANQGKEGVSATLGREKKKQTLGNRVPLLGKTVIENTRESGYGVDIVVKYPER